MTSITFEHELNYRLFGTIWRPVVLVELSYAEEDLTFLALLDSGADVTIFPARVASSHFGIGLGGFPRRLVRAAGASREVYSVPDWTIHICETDVTLTGLTVGFSPQLDEFGHGLLGQDTVFRSNTVAFRRRYHKGLFGS